MSRLVEKNIRYAIFGLSLAIVFGVAGITPKQFVPNTAEAVQCLPGGDDCRVNNGSQIITVCENDCRLSQRCRNGVMVNDATCNPPTALSVTNITVTNIGPTSATITWVTNKSADGRVQYGITSTYELGEVVQGSANSTSHSIPLLNLSPNTTYHFKVTSATATESASTTTDRTLVTSAGSSVGSLPTITLGPRVNATSTQAIVTFSTNVATASLVQYEQTPNTTLNQNACNNANNCVGSNPPVPSALDTNHTIVLTGLTQPSSTYRYKITVIDANNNLFATSEFTFVTSSSSTDHVFSTGGCDDGTPIGQCNATGQFCRPGGGPPVFDCRPNSPCTALCTTGNTCQQNGDCTADPTLSGSPTQCNQKYCYQHCDQNSGGRSGSACTSDSQCVDGPASGRCTAGNFNNPAVAGCYASWPSCDANVILKVTPDRVCDKWLTCKTSLPITDSSGKTENQCFDLTVCNSLSPNGQCNGVLEGGQCSNDPLRFCRTDADCDANGRCITSANGGPLPVTYATPDDVSKIRNLTGYSYAGLDWSTQQNSPRLEGFYPLSMVSQIGTRITVPDSDFEDTRFVGRCKNPVAGVSTCASDAVCTGSGNSCLLQAESEVVVLQNWEAVTPTGSTGTATVHSNSEGNANNRNTFMTVTPTDKPNSGARQTNSARFTTQSNVQYILSVRLRSSQNGQPIKVTLSNDSNVVKTFDDGDTDGVVKLGTAWQTFRLGPVDGPGGLSKINFFTTVTGAVTPFDVDDISMLPALKVNGSTLISQSCRIYPGEDSPKCDYTDGNGITQTGFKGFCLERDPLNTAVCLSWWPVDVLSGENIFSQDATAGYQGRRPVYACAENLGLARKTLVRTCNPSIGACYGTDFSYAYGSGYTSNPFSSSTGTTSRTVVTTDQQLSKNRNIIAHQTPGSGNPEYQLPESAIYAIGWLNDGTNQSFGWPATVIFTADEFKAPQGTVRNYSGVNYKVSRYVEGNDIVWFLDPVSCSEGSNGSDGQCILTFFVFDKTTGRLKYYQWDGADHTGNGAEGTYYDIIFYTREVCTKLVQVVNPTRDSAWVDRTSNTSTYVVNGLNYRQMTDYKPFGGAVLPDASTTPDQLPQGFQLSANGPDTTLPEPNQVRAGSVYACNGNCNVKRCDVESGSKSQNFCLDASDCYDSNASPTPLQGQCVGGGLCASYSATLNKYTVSNNARSCVQASDCSSGEECIGGAASAKGGQSFNASSATDITGFYAQYRLQRLFAQAFSVWQWNATTGQYQDVTNTSATTIPWSPPSSLCRVCSGTGPNAGKACTSDGSCGAGSTCGTADRHPTANANQTTDSGADYCAIQPKITNVNGNDSLVTIGEGGVFILKFNTQVDREQVPITRITIDWGDGSARTVDSNLRIAAREDTSSPHAYSHTYHCSDVRCEYTPKVQIEDSWGWCSDGTRAGAVGCNNNPKSTTNPWAGAVRVVVE